MALLRWAVSGYIVITAGKLAGTYRAVHANSRRSLTETVSEAEP
jgi:hypothetical protein